MQCVCARMFLIIISNVMCKITNQNQNEKDSTGEAGTYSSPFAQCLCLSIYYLLKTYEHLNAYIYNWNRIVFRSIWSLSSWIIPQTLKTGDGARHPFWLTTNDTESIYTLTFVDCA